MVGASAVQGCAAVASFKAVITKRMESEINPNNSKDENVDVVVGKYKRAAGFLWTILHAQSCKLPAGKCSIQGCSDIKRLLAHVLSCAACHSDVCPTGYEGCHQARKLIGHHHECKKQKRVQRNKEQKSHCLLCTLLSRHKPIRITFDRTGSSASPLNNGSMINRRKETELLVSPLIANRMSPSLSMPPPPPRPRATSQCSSNFSQRSPMSTCLLTRPKHDENDKRDSATPPSRKVARIRSGSLDGRKVHANSNRYKIDPTVESRLKLPSGRNGELRPNKSLTCDNMMNSCRRRSMSCSNMPSSSHCDTIFEDVTTDHV